MYIYFKMTRAISLSKPFSESGLQGENFKSLLVIFCFYIVAKIAWKWKKSGRKGYQGVIQMM